MNCEEYVVNLLKEAEKSNEQKDYEISALRKGIERYEEVMRMLFDGALIFKGEEGEFISANYVRKDDDEELFTNLVARYDVRRLPPKDNSNV